MVNTQQKAVLLLLGEFSVCGLAFLLKSFLLAGLHPFESSLYKIELRNGFLVMVCQSVVYHLKHVVLQWNSLKEMSKDEKM